MNTDTKPTDSIDFGFEQVAVEEKRERVREVFASVASKYDIMNDAMSLGIHRAWKSILLDRLNPRPHMTLVDVAGGTGDIAFGFLRRGGGQAFVCDINDAMLAHGMSRRDRPKTDESALTWICGNAECLPLPHNCADAYTITFGIRNVTHRDKALSEARRVLKPGGHFLCLEFSMPDVPLLDDIYDVYSFEVLPRLGSLIAGDGESYRYLVESIRQFPDPETFAGMIEAAGLTNVTRQSLSGGIATLYSAWRV
jgi:demethylmenaquinone methyltransferase/2-methoxy-6-polyprenyl-1,4-benzoquinol methylase